MATIEDIQFHYDVSNGFYALFLDQPRMVYSCGVWDTALTLEEAQVAKLERLAGFAGISAGHRVLDVGCGWGGMLRFAIEERGASSGHGLTLSEAQKAYIEAGVSDGSQITVDLRSWTQLPDDAEKYDAIVSVGAFEHFASLEDRDAGRQREIYRRFFDICYRASSPTARLGLQTIVTARPPSTSAEVRDTKYLLKHVFPGSTLPSISDIQAACADLYEISEVRRIGLNYARTLKAWRNRLIENRERAKVLVSDEVYEHYLRYFDSADRSFEAGVVDLYQASLQKVQHFRGGS